MDNAHRKLELQSPADLAYLTSQIRTAARQKLDLHLPPVSDTTEPDELRCSVETLVDTFLAQVLQGMRHNISINGIDVLVARERGGEAVNEQGHRIHGVSVNEVGLEEKEGGGEVEHIEYEAFDDKLRTRLASTIAKRDALIAGISQHRRTTAAAAAKTLQAQFESENEAMLTTAAEMERSASVVEEGDLARIEGIPRQGDMGRSWERAVEGLQRLNKGLPETRARLERAGHVVGYLGGGK
ncbi:hypothetical protein EJ02DRAFT_408286 [Clathrospora elynae]|uniref:Kinetochore protein mis14 n=1 Tax=Clathrospora elynae TaxID=706981 RepID=A0A6A5SG48_9PLEO|nr:hypothetical protein EJ02DRAFT_408286 [Clathrospora elynae]